MQYDWWLHTLLYCYAMSNLYFGSNPGPSILFNPTTVLLRYV